MEKLCLYCSQLIAFEIGRDFSRHCANCKSRPNYPEKIENQRQTILNRRKDHTFHCNKCNQKYILNLTPFQYKHKIYRKHCSYKCSCSRIWTKAINKERSQKLKGDKNPNYNPNKFEKRTCIVCDNEFIVIHWKKQITCKSKQCLSKINSQRAKERKFGGHTSKQTLYYKCKEGNIVYLQSSFELKTAKLLDKNKIKWIRPSPIKWVDKNNEYHWYYPDFYLVEQDIFLDPKNYYLIKKDKEKIDQIIKQNNIKLFILNEEQITQKYINNLISTNIFLNHNRAA